MIDGSAAAGESGYQSLQAYLSLDQVSRHISLPAALCQLACAKMSAKTALLELLPQKSGVCQLAVNQHIVQHQFVLCLQLHIWF